MKTVLLMILFCGSAFAGEVPPDGSVLFWEDGFGQRIIERKTGSYLTHAAVVLGGYVYEAVPPCVQKVPYAEYVANCKHKWFVIVPKTPYTDAQVKLMVAHAESQLGRPYMLRGWNKRLTRGIFCSQLVSDVLGHGGKIKSDSFRESPGSLYRKLKTIYVEYK